MNQLTDAEIDERIRTLNHREQLLRDLIRQSLREADALEIEQMNLKRIKHGRRTNGNDWS